MGLLDQIRAMTVTQRGIAWIDASGRHRAEMPVDAFDGNGIVSADEILRGDLAAILYDASRPGVSYLFDDTITALEQHLSRFVTFEKADPRRFDGGRRRWIAFRGTPAGVRTRDERCAPTGLAECVVHDTRRDRP